MNDVVRKDATLSPCGTYRYRLKRLWDDRIEPLVWVMLNPSTADAEVDDNTIRRVVAFSQREGKYGGAVVLNLYALRATNPKALARHPQPYGPRNDAVLDLYARSPFDMVAAWGAHAPVHAARILTGPLRDRRLLCLGKTKDGHPRHPLYVKGDRPFEVYR